MKALAAILLLVLHSGAVALRNPSSDLVRARALTILQDNCLTCHGALKTSGLDLRSRATLLSGGKHGPDIVPGNPEKSRLFRFVSGLDKTQMPPVRRLSAQQVADIRAWIAAGAPFPEKAIDARPWPFNPVTRPQIPKPRNTVWINNPIDTFILNGLEAHGLKPAPAADKRTLIRRATLDLIGLPPTPEEVEAFVKDSSPNAFAKVVDRLLASPHYGERWARHWLDLARYAESEGFKSDEMRPNAWRYRDYVIKSLNDDKPYDRFIREQIAGDELYPDDRDALVATGFCRHYADESNARNLSLRRQEILNDITETVGSNILGLTVGCARCHDHKYDPIPQRDYYRLQAFFAAVRPRDDICLLNPVDRAQYDAQLHEWEGKTADIRTELSAIEKPLRDKIYHSKFVKFPQDTQDAVLAPPDKRTSLQWIIFRKAEPQLAVTDLELSVAVKPADKPHWTELKKKLDSFKSQHPGPLPVALGITDVGAEAPKTYTLQVGVYDKPIQEVEPGVPTILDSLPLPPDNCCAENSTGRRSALAQWLTSPNNPLTARVMVNRVWQYHFGRGLVGTPSDFGATGDKPSNRALLDWLANAFSGPDSQLSTLNSQLALGWSLKKLHRLIMLSAAYQQSAAYDPKAGAIDPDNRLVWRFQRQRLEGEAIRDSILAVSGELNPKLGGPSIMPELPDGVTTRGYWKADSDEAQRNRRSIYVFVKRNLRYPLFQAFDMPDTHEPCPRRESTVTATQALMLLNDERILKSTDAFAKRIATEAGDDMIARIDRAYRLAFSRPPTDKELTRAAAFIKRNSLADFCHALINANEFLYVE